MNDVLEAHAVVQKPYIGGLSLMSNDPQQSSIQRRFVVTVDKGRNVLGLFSILIALGIARNDPPAGWSEQ